MDTIGYVSRSIQNVPFPKFCLLDHSSITMATYGLYLKPWVRNSWEPQFCGCIGPFLSRQKGFKWIQPTLLDTRLIQNCCCFHHKALFQLQQNFCCSHAEVPDILTIILIEGHCDRDILIHPRKVNHYNLSPCQLARKSVQLVLLIHP